MEFTLSNVISGRFCDPEKGWIDKQFVLTEAQKTAFVNVFGHGCQEPRKHRLRTFIDNLEGQRVRALYDLVVFYDDPENRHGTLCQYFGPGDTYPTIRKQMCGW
jgi:hypothetical protein